MTRIEEGRTGPGLPTPSLTRIALIEVEDDDFDWLRDPAVPPRRRLLLADGGIHSAEVMDIVRDMTRQLHAAGCRGSWMIVDDDIVFGMFSFRHPPENGRVEIGYGVAESCYGKGYASAAVAHVIQIAAADPKINRLTAETAVSNPASGRVLEKNGFTSTGNRVDVEDGDLILWERAV
jgi:RimJ/RimL family protein N-acetyltransferase